MRLSRSSLLHLSRIRSTLGVVLAPFLLGSCVYYVSDPPDMDSSVPMPVSTSSWNGAGGQHLPDPRYRSPMGIEELDRVASMVSRASGGGFRGSIGLGPDPGPTCRIRGPQDGGEIQVHPVALNRVPPNSWAFIFGHEFAHQSGRYGAHGSTTPELELKADIQGVEYARRAGFDLAAHLGWIFSRPNRGSDSHGGDHERAQAIARHYGINPAEIGMHVQRYRQTGL